MNKIDNLFQKILNKTKTAEVDYFILANYDSIKKALNLNISYQKIYEAVIEESNLSISYSSFVRRLKSIDTIKTKDKLDTSQINIPPTPEIKNEITPDTISSNEPKIIKSEQKRFSYNNNKLR